MTSRIRYECPACGTRCSIPHNDDDRPGDPKAPEVVLCPSCEDPVSMVPLEKANDLVRAERPRPKSDGNYGVGLVSDMGGAISHLFRTKHGIVGRGLENEKGELVEVSKGLEVNLNEVLGEPEVESVEVGDDGQVKKLKVKPHQWPPKKETF